MINLINNYLNDIRRKRKYVVIEISGRWYTKQDTKHEYTKRKYNNLNKAFKEEDKLNERFKNNR